MENQEKWKYGMYKGKFCSEMTREELLEVVKDLGESEYRLRTKPCIHDEILAPTTIGRN